MKLKKANKERQVLFIVLPLIALACLFLWYVRNYYRVDGMTRAASEQGVFDLAGVDLETGFVRLEGEVLYLPGILTPEEFAARENEAQRGNPRSLPSATSRIRILAPDDGTYMMTAGSIDYAHRVYVNGALRFEAGAPAQTAEDFTPGYAQMTLEVTAQNGVIEIIQQGANFVHREGGGHANLYFGRPAAIQRFLSLTFGPEYLTVGLFAALFIVHLVLFLVQRSYKPNRIFALLCLTWMVRSGLTGAKVFYAMFPALPWQAAFRSEYLSLPVAAILMVLLVQEIFPGVPQKWFVRIVGAVSAVFSVLCLAADTVLLSWALMPYELFFTLAIIYLCARFGRKAPELIRGKRLQIEQTVSLVGFGFFMVAAINDALYHAGALQALGLPIAFDTTGLAMLLFSFFQMTAMFYGTMRETALAHEREKRAEAAKEMLAEMNRLKSAFYADMSHEMKTPLTVISVNAQFAAQKIEAGVVDEETLIDLNAISTEAKRLAQMVTNLVGIGRMQGGFGERAVLAPVSLLTETARIYQSLFARKKNTLTTDIPPDLPRVEGSADQLIQVLINLLSNANRHTSAGVVELRAEVQKSKLKVSVTDNGEGIAPDLLPHVFERYCHGENGGSGLGLSICKSIIEEHGGKIGIESKEGKGTTVWFTLPVRENAVR